MTSSLIKPYVAGLHMALCLAALTSLVPVKTLAADTLDPKEVTVLGRSWVVAPAPQAPGFFTATRLNNNLSPFRPPAVLSVRQAVRAFHSATGCRPNSKTIYRVISGTYYATLTCPENK